MSDNWILDRLEGIRLRFDEVSQLITDPTVINDMKRYIKLNKEYRELEPIVEARREYKNILSNLDAAKEILNTEKDEEMRDMAKGEIDELSAKIGPLEEEIKLLLLPADPGDRKNAMMEIRAGTGGMKRVYLQAIYFECIPSIASKKDGKYRLPVFLKARWEVIRK